MAEDQNLDIIGSQPDQYHGDLFTTKFEIRIDSPDRTAILPIIEIYEQLLTYNNGFVVAWSGAAQTADYVNHQVRLSKYTASICDCPDDLTKTITETGTVLEGELQLNIYRLRSILAGYRQLPDAAITAVR